MGSRLTESRTRILSHMVAHADRGGPAMSAREISRMCGEHDRASDWAHGKLREMAWHGLVERVGVTFEGARTWRVTPQGRTALEDSHGK